MHDTAAPLRSASALAASLARFNLCISASYTAEPLMEGARQQVFIFTAQPLGDRKATSMFWALSSTRSCKFQEAPLEDQLSNNYTPR